MNNIKLANPPNHGENRRIGALDGVRGVAVLMVVIYHFLMTVGSHNIIERSILSVVRRGWVGIELFFVLSGFLITGILWNARVQRQPDSLRNFYARRFLRISPLYCASLLLVLGVGMMVPILQTPGWHKFLHDQIYCWLYAVNIGRAYHGPAFFFYDWFDFTHFWTLAVEEHFYLVWPWVVLLTNRRGFLTVCLILLVGSWGTRIWAVSGGSGWIFALTASLRQSESIIIGSLLAILWNREQSRQWCQRASRPICIFFGLISIGLLTATSSKDAAPIILFGPLVFGLAFAGFLAILLEAPQTSLPKRVFESKFLRFFGKYSYGIYIFHHLFFPVWMNIQDKVAEMSGIYRLGVLVMFVTASTVTIGLSLLSWNLLEMPLLGFKKYFEPASTQLAPANRSNVEQPLGQSPQAFIATT